MSLFICSCCGVIENTNLVNNDKVATKYNATLPEGMEFFPHMSLSDMMGEDDQNIYLNNEVWKMSDEVKMLCSQCNTGIWHNEFKRDQAGKEDQEIAFFSKYNAITPMDHERGCLAKTSDIGDDYFVLESYKAMHAIFRNAFNKDHTDHMSEYKEGFFYLAYQVYVEDPMNFIPSVVDGVDWNDRRDVEMWILDSLVYKEESKSKTYNTELAGLMSMFPNAFSSILNQLDKKAKKSWKEDQSDEEKQSKLAAAAAKRLRKAEKRKK